MSIQSKPCDAHWLNSWLPLHCHVQCWANIYLVLGIELIKFMYMSYSAVENDLITWVLLFSTLCIKGLTRVARSNLSKLIEQTGRKVRIWSQFWSQVIVEPCTQTQSYHPLEVGFYCTWVQISGLLLVSCEHREPEGTVPDAPTQHTAPFFWDTYTAALKHTSLPSWGALTHLPGTARSHANVWAEAHDPATENTSMWFSSNKPWKMASCSFTCFPSFLTLRPAPGVLCNPCALETTMPTEKQEGREKIEWESLQH